MIPSCLSRDFELVPWNELSCLWHELLPCSPNCITIDPVHVLPCSHLPCLSSAEIRGECRMDLANFLKKNFDKDTTLRVALGNQCVLGVEKHAGPWWCGGIPKGLDNKLRGRQQWLPLASFVALDPSDEWQYYVQFKDGNSQWDGPDGLTEAIHNQQSQVEVVCFAPDGGWYDLCPLSHCTHVDALQQ